MIMPPGNRREEASPEKRSRALIGVAVAVGVMVFLSALGRGFSAHRFFSGFAPIIFILIVFFLVRSFARSARGRQRLEETGVPALARVIEAHNTHANVMDKAIVSFQLEVQPPGGSSFTAHTRALIPHSDLNRYVTGAAVRVRYDPATPGQVVIVGLAEAAPERARPAAPAMPRAMDEAAETAAFNQQMKTTGTLARATVIEVHETGQTQDNSRFLKFLLEVKPVGGEPFKARAAAFVRVALLSDFEPGDEVWVKHDPKRTDRVALFNA